MQDFRSKPWNSLENPFIMRQEIVRDGTLPEIPDPGSCWVFELPQGFPCFGRRKAERFLIREEYAVAFNAVFKAVG
jgi:hypothetical protein